MSFPNFTRWEQYLHAAIAADGNQPMLLWQVPLGNQYFQTENNTNGHFQDNRAEYIFGHMPELISIGVVGALFGAGNGGNTTYSDASKDGITNPASFCTTDGISPARSATTTPRPCRTTTAATLECRAQAYYAHPVPLSGGTAATATPTATATLAATATPTRPATATPTRTATPRPTNTPTARPTGTRTATPTSTRASQPGFTSTGSVSPSSVQRGSAVGITTVVKSNTAISALVDLEVYDASGAKVFQQWWDNRAFSAGGTLTLSTTWAVPVSAVTGAYTVVIGVFSPGWGSLYSWNSNAAGVAVT